jgi:hypothetical protein
MRPTYALLALLPLLFSASCVYAVPVDELALSQSSDLDFTNADEAEDYGAADFELGLGSDDDANEDEDLRGGRKIRQAVKKILPSRGRQAPPAPPAKPVAKPAPAPSTVIRRAAPVVLPVSVATHKFIPVPATQSAKADKVAHYISVLNTDIDKNHRVFMSQYNAELAKLRDISKKKIYTQEEYLKAQRELNGKYKVWKETLHAFSVSNSTLSSLRHHNSSFTEEKNLLTHLYEYVKMFSTKQGYYKHNCVCNATIVGDLRSVQSATTLS